MVHPLFSPSPADFSREIVGENETINIIMIHFQYYTPSLAQTHCMQINIVI